MTFLTGSDILEANMEKFDSKLLGLVVVFFIVFGFFATSIVFNKPLKELRIRATAVKTADPDQSHLVVFPLTTKVGSNATINCIARDAEGTALSNANCRIETSCGTISPGQVSTNVNGIAIFSLSADTPCVASLKAIVNDTVAVSQGTSVEFTQ